MRSFCFLPLAAALIIDFFSRCVLAAVAAVDQSYIPPTTTSVLNVGAANGNDWAQTFTVGTAGQLTGFDLWLDRDPVVVLPLLFDIRTTVAGVPTQPDFGPSVLAQGSFAADVFQPLPVVTGAPPAALQHFDLSGSALNVVAGDVLAIVLRSDDPGPTGLGLTYHWHAVRLGDYPAGSAFFRVGSENWSQRTNDVVFRTYVTPVPEPSSVCLVVAIACIWAVARRRGMSAARA